MLPSIHYSALNHSKEDTFYANIVMELNLIGKFKDTDRLKLMKKNGEICEETLQGWIKTINIFNDANPFEGLHPQRYKAI